VDLTPYANSTVRVRFRVDAFYIYNSNRYGTWYVDEISVAEPGEVAGMSITPAQMYFDLHPGDNGAQTLNIANPGTNVLNFAISEGLPAATAQATNAGGAPAAASGGGEGRPNLADLPWLSVSPAAGAISPGQNQNVTISCDGSVGVGNYTGYLVITGNDPVADVVVVPIGLTVSNLLLTTPVPSDSLLLGATYSINWSVPQGVSVQNADIRLSTDGGDTFDFLITTVDVLSPGAYSWHVSAPISDMCKLRISGMSGGSEVADESDGLFTIYGSPTGIEPPAPVGKTALLQNVPNPFNPVTTIRYSLAAQTHVSLRIYDVNGALVRVLVDDVQSPGTPFNTVVWDGRNKNGQPAPSGVYFYHLVADGVRDSRKMVLLK